MKLPRWAYSVARTHRRQPSLPLATLTRLALSTLETSITRLRTAHPSVPLYSETQAHFWLEYMGLGSPSQSGPTKVVSREAWGPNNFGILVAQGAYDVYAWEAKYSAQLWQASEARRDVVEPDMDGVWKMEETAGVKAEVGGRQRDVFLEELERGMVGTGRIEEGRANRWLREVLGVMEPYVRIWEGVWPAAEEGRGEVLRRILVDNGQLFARWKLPPGLKEFSFALGPREWK
ncbi:hypothetical protein N7516_009760 [Penicillium verrucosum]|uniref:uncharacterized protein n=1 Tax=Penicillium verrucosum TaxID=60171 RepID=UPI0025454849|nr:uncharacterized protein N7516_009760 [Penicillium verrucosum]KAJ5922057.1 hypothetical protein N7516_009760 [Penicillium verrucosum]